MQWTNTEKMRLQKSGLLIEVNTTLSVAEKLTGPFFANACVRRPARR